MSKSFKVEQTEVKEMKEETYKEYTWHGKDVNEVFKKLGIEGNIVTIYADNDSGRLYLHVKTITDSEGD